MNPCSAPKNRWYTGSGREASSATPLSNQNSNTYRRLAALSLRKTHTATDDIAQILHFVQAVQRCAPSHPVVFDRGLRVDTNGVEPCILWPKIAVRRSVQTLSRKETSPKTFGERHTQGSRLLSCSQRNAPCSRVAGCTVFNDSIVLTYGLCEIRNAVAHGLSASMSRESTGLSIAFGR